MVKLFISIMEAVNFEVSHGSLENLERAFTIIQKFSDHPTDTTFLSSESTLFFHRKKQAFLNCAVIGRDIIIFGGIVSKPIDYTAVLTDFLGHTTSHNLRVSVMMLLKNQVDLFGAAGFGIHQMGTSYSCRTQDFQLSGSQYGSIRNMVKTAKDAGVTVQVLALNKVSKSQEDQLNTVDYQWLNDKKSDKPRVKYVVGDRNYCLKNHAQIVVAIHNKKIIAYHTLQPTFGRHPGWMVDSTRRAPNSIKGLSEILVISTIRAIQSGRLDGEFYHFGNAPLDGISKIHQSGYERPIASIIMEFMQKYPDTFYNSATGLANYKHKWHVDSYPEYYGYYPNFSASSAITILKGIGAI